MDPASRRPAPRRAADVGPYDLVSFGMAVVLFGAGVFVLAAPRFRTVPVEIRVVFGVLLLLLSVYRTVVTLSRRRRARLDEELAAMREEVRREVRAATSDPSDPPTP